MATEPLAPQSMVEPALSEAAAFTVSTLEALLPRPSGPEARLLEAMRRAVLAPGRRLRAFLVLQSGRLFGVDRRPLGRVAAAVECVHAYIRIHTGLPAFGGAAQGRADEVTAVLAGDALLTQAFALVSAAEGIGDPFMRAELTSRLAQTAGHAGLLGGEMLETVFLDGTGASTPPLPEISRLQRMKTAALVTFCCETGAVLGHASPAARHALSAYGQDIGLAIQITSDLALAGSEGQASLKPTVVSALGPERARSQAVALAEQAVRHLDLFDEKADLLRAAAEFVVPRRLSPQ